MVSYTLACVTEHAALWYAKPASARLLQQADDEQDVDSRISEARRQVAKVSYVLCVFQILHSASEIKSCNGIARQNALW